MVIGMSPDADHPQQVRIRPAGPADLPALQALLDRTSPESQYRRFHGAVGASARRELERITHPTDAHHSWVADDGRDLHGTATLAWGHDGVAEAAFMVEDSWFRRGLGAALFGALAVDARQSGAERVVAYVQADNQAARRFLRAVAPGASTRFVGGGEVEVVVPVQSAGAVPPVAPTVPIVPPPAFAKETA
jgi:ribosomal protein S18 acetylase RimI-like enzyme